MKVALTIAGSDPSGGAGIQADLKTFHQHGIYGEAVITLLTVQNTRTVERVEVVDPELVVAQIRSVVADIPPDAAKTGALGKAAIVEAVASEARRFSFPLVIDPVMISKHGSALMEASACDVFCTQLLPHATLVTPNLPEAAMLTGHEISDLSGMRSAARRLIDMGCKAVLVKGGHLIGAATDVLFTDSEFYEFSAARVNTPHTHGTGCTYSAAIAANLAKGDDVFTAVKLAKDYISRAILTNPGLGGGSGPVNHFA